MRFQALFVSPEMCLDCPSARNTFQQLGLNGHILACVIDESHCISQWGGDFRKLYADIDKLLAKFPRGTPVLAGTATLGHDATRELYNKLQLKSQTCFHLNLGNDRPNIFTEIHTIKSSRDFACELSLLLASPQC